MGKARARVDLKNFARVQKLLGEKIYKAREFTCGSELISCCRCGRPVTYKIVIKKKSGTSYIYYRCARCEERDHPRIRLREEENRRADDRAVRPHQAARDRAEMASHGTDCVVRPGIASLKINSKPLIERMTKGLVKSG